MFWSCHKSMNGVNLDSIRASSGRERPLIGLLGDNCAREIAKTLQIENCKILILVQITNKWTWKCDGLTKPGLRRFEPIHTMDNLIFWQPVFDFVLQRSYKDLFIRMYACTLSFDRQMMSQSGLFCDHWPWLMYLFPPHQWHPLQTTIGCWR